MRCAYPAFKRCWKISCRQDKRIWQNTGATTTPLTVGKNTVPPRFLVPTILFNREIT